MADLDINNPYGMVDKRVGRGNSTTSNVLTTVANLDSVADMKARLTAINGTSYTAARLATMTKNDMLYAIRLNDDAAGI